MFSQCVYSASWSGCDFIPEGKQNIESMAFALNRFVKVVVAVIFNTVLFFFKCYSEHLPFQDIFANEILFKGEEG